MLVRLRERDRDEAARFLELVEKQLMALAGGDEDAAELGSPWRAAQASEGHRLYVRERTDGLWLIAVWPEGTSANRQFGFGSAGGT